MIVASRSNDPGFDGTKVLREYQRIARTLIV
jgi:hypothetical protein